MDQPIKLNSDQDIYNKLMSYGLSEQLISSLSPFETIRLIELSQEFDEYTNYLIDKKSSSSAAKLLLHKLNNYLWLKTPSVETLYNFDSQSFTMPFKGKKGDVIELINNPLTKFNNSNEEKSYYYIISGKSTHPYDLVKEITSSNDLIYETLYPIPNIYKVGYDIPVSYWNNLLGTLHFENIFQDWISNPEIIFDLIYIEQDEIKYPYIKGVMNIVNLNSPIHNTISLVIPLSNQQLETALSYDELKQFIIDSNYDDHYILSNTDELHQLYHLAFDDELETTFFFIPEGLSNLNPKQEFNVLQEEYEP